MHTFADQIQGALQTTEVKESSFDLLKVFYSCPIIYGILLFMSLASFVIWLYSLLTLRLSDMMPSEFIVNLRKLLLEHRYETAIIKCHQDNNFSSSIIVAGITARKHGPQVMMEIMRSEGRRLGNILWQRISLLNEIAIIAPMLGLLGTVLGLFFAFYDSTRSTESIAALFDGLGIAVGTTVLGLVVAIIAMVFFTMLKFRVIRLLNAIENESLSLVNVISSDAKAEQPAQAQTHTFLKPY
jgi:biopolymer transport protein ExbB